MWRSRDLTLFGKVLIIKALGISSLVYSASNVDVPGEVIDNVKGRIFRFLWKNKKDKIKRVGLYQDYHRGGLCMVDVETFVKSLHLAWIPRLICSCRQHWKVVPDHCFNKQGGLKLLLNCNYSVDFVDDLPNFYKDMLKFFSELTSLYSNNSWRDQLLYNNKDILIGGKPFFNREWYSKGVRVIRDLLSEDGSFLSYSNFRNKYSLNKTNFLQFYQVISAIPNYLLSKARTQNPTPA